MADMVHPSETAIRYVWERLLEIAERDNDNRPVMTSEYAHSMGNALGNFQEYWSMDESLNQPSSVKDDCPMGCKLLLYGNKVEYAYSFVCTV